MTWIAMRDRKPKEGDYVITRFRGLSGKDCFEYGDQWKDSNLAICYHHNDGSTSGHITHWWDGMPDIDLAAQEWEK